MSHEVLYRKWRPLVFDDLVGQEHISKTLLNAIKTNKISHAYIFCGPRGTGKTTTARILAKTLNCENLKNYSPCNKCKSCIEIMNGSSLDIIEIDAASNRGISEIRSIIEQVKFSSVSGKYKVYIIDEFHMLTVDASNAILKTLEEPPDKVVFILATTEVHKILPTIISRCQKFDFQRIPINSLFNRLKYISKKENIKISDESLLAIAKKSNGGLRDALSLLDQISSFAIDVNENISNELISQVLGLIGFKYLKNIAKNIYENNPVSIIEEINNLLKAGNDPSVIVTETISFFRNLLIVKNSPSIAEYLEVPSSNIKEIQEIVNYFSNNEILEIINLLDSLMDKIKRTTQAQLWLEINFVQLCKIPKNNQLINCNQNNSIDSSLINELKNKLIQLENRINDLERNKLKVQTNYTTSSNSKVSEDEKTNDSIINDNHNFNEIWEKILNVAKIKTPPTYALITNAKIDNIDTNNKIFTISFENEAFIELLKRKQDKFQECMNKVLGEKYKLVIKKISKDIDLKVSQTNKFLDETLEKNSKKEDDLKENNKLTEDLKEINYQESVSDNYQMEEKENYIKNIVEIFDGKIVKLKRD
ncbi:MAG: DNA polymerase III subunit gamma/tau [Candidatus Sericytochromatia bacterium]|nr:MAG: DNA polymerase III subunit gamma/tau [Candidatus Sericytochromatia bacterium]